MSFERGISRFRIHLEKAADATETMRLIETSSRLIECLELSYLQSIGKASSNEAPNVKLSILNFGANRAWQISTVVYGE